MPPMIVFPADPEATADAFPKLETRPVSLVRFAGAGPQFGAGNGTPVVGSTNELFGWTGDDCAPAPPLTPAPPPPD